MEDNNDKIFFRLWRNIVINRIIFKYFRLYTKNKVIGFGDIKSLREYSEREFITKLVYPNNNVGIKVETILKGDFPENGVLKELDFSSLCKSSTNNICEAIPQTVEIIRFNSNFEIQLSELPVSVNTLFGIRLKKPYIDNPIPLNIKTISFSGTIDPIEFYDIKIPNSVVHLNLICLYFIKSKLKTLPPPTFIPSSVLELNIIYDESVKSNLPIIPSTVKKLNIFICGGICRFENGLIPYGVEILHISNSSTGSFNLSKGSLPESITKLYVHSVKKISYNSDELNPYNQIEAYSIPSSVLDLYIKFKTYPSSFDGVFPNSLTKLNISSFDDNANPPPSISELPSTIKSLKIGNLNIK